ncbi:MAG: plasmid pRiA4b ORF-3 family protein, partial [Planctomycetota bacterium]
MSRVAMNARDLWMSIPAAGRSFSEKERGRGDFLYSTERSCTLALLELFGLMTVERDDPDEGQSWRVTEVRHTPFGDELLRIVFDEIDREFFAYEKRAIEFGAWQPLLRSYFPQWVNNLKVARSEFRDGVYYFKVSLGKPWRRIAIPAKSDLDDLAECIIRAFDFDGEHLYGFQFVARDGRQIRVEHPYIDDAETHTDELAIGELPLNEGQSIQFQYDFGADWRFEVQLEKVEPEV